MKSFLNDSQVKTLTQLHRVIKGKRYADRIKAVLLLNQGLSYEDVARILLLEETVIRTYLRLYQEKGAKALIENHYVGKQALLTEKQERFLKMHLKIKTYLRTQEIATYIQDRFTVAYSVSGATRLLHRLGFVYKKAKIIPGKADASKQQAFLIEYESLKQNKRPEDAMYFGDGCHPHHNVIPAYGWVEKGKDHEVRSNTGRERLNLYGALNAETHKAVITSEPTVNADSVIRLCEKLLMLHVQGTVYLILDNARYQRSKKVAEFLKSHPRMQIKYLPSYSPNLNLIERLWLFFQKKMLYNQYYKDLKTFEQAALHFFDNLGRYRTELSTLLTDNFQVIGAN